MLTGRVVAYDGEIVTIQAPFRDIEQMIRKGVSTAQVTLDDGRTISAEQRKKLYATFNDIANYTGHVPEEVKQHMKYDFISETGCEDFSLSDVDMSTANAFLGHVIDFCIKWGIPTQDSLLDRAPDIAHYIYMCAVQKRCCITGKKEKVELHHVDAVGMGRSRKEIIHIGMEVIPLSDELHREFHQIGKQSFFDKYHVFGVVADDRICNAYKLRKGRKTNE